MHELSVAQRIVEIVEEQASKSGLARVTAIRVRIGRLSTIVPEALNFCFGFATEDTLAAGAELVIEEVPAEAKCNACGKTFPVEEAYFLLCPSCSSPDTTLLKGQELDLMSIEGETEEGETQGGEVQGGQTPEGETPEREAPEGQTHKGETREGETPDGQTYEGKPQEDSVLVKGARADGTPADGSRDDRRLAEEMRNYGTHGDVTPKVRDEVEGSRTWEHKSSELRTTREHT